MIYRKLGNSGIEASVIALGTWVMGGWMWGGAEENESIKAIDASLDNGVNLLDTAPIYGFGYSEEVVGKAIKGKRSKVVLATKCGLRWNLEKGDFYFYSNERTVVSDSSQMKVYKYLGPESIKEEIETSLKRLQTDYIDLYQTHWQESTTPIEDTMAVLLKLKDEGKIRAIGVSNANVEQMKKYGAIDTDQEKYHMLARKIEEQGNVDYCVKNNIAILAYSPLAQGLLTGKVSLDRKFNEGDVRLNNPLFKEENLIKINKMLDEFRPIAENYNATLGQLVSAWTFNRKGITHLLCGARNAEQAIENAKAADIYLAENDIQTIDKIFSKYF
jgi:aryl-alcohol dehydrogenase-like predicted oxidoreductase